MKKEHPLSFDRNLIVGASAASFAVRLKELIESGSGLYENEARHVDSLAGEVGRSAKQEANKAS